MRALALALVIVLASPSVVALARDPCERLGNLPTTCDEPPALPHFEEWLSGDGIEEIPLPGVGGVEEPQPPPDASVCSYAPESLPWQPASFLTGYVDRQLDADLTERVQEHSRVREPCRSLLA